MYKFFDYNISRTDKSGQSHKVNTLGVLTNLNEGLVHSIKYMREQGVGIRKIVKDLSVGVGTVYKVLEAA